MLYNARNMFRNERVVYSREEVMKVTKLIKNGSRPTSRGLSDSLGISMGASKMFLSYADAWIYRERVDDLIEQARTGELEGATPVATLDGREEQ